MLQSTCGSDNLTRALGALQQFLPEVLIDEVIREFSRSAKRVRKLPPTLVAYLVVAMGIFRDLNVSDVLLKLLDSLDRRCPRARLPHPTSIAAARDRLGWEVMRALFERVARTLRGVAVDATTWRGLEVYALDGTTLATADTKENEHWFGRPGTAHDNQSAFPRVRALFLVGVWSHLVVEAVLGPYSESELDLARHMLSRLKVGSMILVDRAYWSFQWPALFLRSNVHFAIRAKQKGHSTRLIPHRRLGVNDWICRVERPRRYTKRSDFPEFLVLRRVQCNRKGFRPVVVVTDLLDRDRYPASEIAALYRARWEGELTYRELKVYFTQRQMVLRSKKPNRVLQEVYGLLIAFNCVRALMYAAARKAGCSPTEISFAESLHRIRWALLACSVGSRMEDELIADLAECRLPPRREGRSYVRALKKRIATKYPRKRNDGRMQSTPSVSAARNRQKRQAAAS